LHPSEAEWLKRAQQGDTESFSRLVELYNRSIFNLCYRMLGNANDAEDAAQEAFIRAYKAIHRYDPSRKFSTWLMSIASNYCIDQHRRKKLPSFSIDALEEPNFGDNSPSLEGQVMHGEQHEEIMDLLEYLKPKDKAAIIMRYWYDYSYDEIAETLSITSSAVKSRLHRARNQLAEIFMELKQSDMISIERNEYDDALI
jgi:RNA polymerase sigma-70 factor (ECF subfamily)